MLVLLRHSLRCLSFENRTRLQMCNPDLYGPIPGDCKSETETHLSNSRFDVAKFFAALDEIRRSEKLSWKGVAEKAGVSASTLTRIGQGKRPDVDGMAALSAWANLDANSFIVKLDNTPVERETLSEISALLRADSKLKGRDAEMLEAMLRSAYQTMRSKDDDDPS
ncbi:hypothetical protein HY29_15645 [Hyphomonas beringensis]|uniref:Uncharacterized protein n=1 Tax=Hyphomonas beringensis TaxID=1280946 RepID=A0A062UDK0_9PROT|nr:hypothetical protein HY29_15645 [Hyphomonas beringensis]